MSKRPSDMHTLIRFLTDTMSMTEVYQPVVIRELVKNGGRNRRINSPKPCPSSMRPCSNTIKAF